MKLVIGLGNPGKKYEKTRHNVGFVILDALHDALLADHFELSPWEDSAKFLATLSGTRSHGGHLLLAKPTTFMNDSGKCGQALAHFYKLTANDIIVVHDDKDLPLGTIRVENNRGDAGHNGVKSLIAELNTKAFMRVRVGVASENPRKMKDTADFVLGKFGLFEKKAMRTMITDTVIILKKWIDEKKEI